MVRRAGNEGGGAKAAAVTDFPSYRCSLVGGARSVRLPPRVDGAAPRRRPRAAAVLGEGCRRVVDAHEGVRSHEELARPAWRVALPR